MIASGKDWKGFLGISALGGKWWEGGQRGGGGETFSNSLFYKWVSHEELYDRLS